MTITLTPRAGEIDEIGREDDRSGHNGSGYERDETDQYHRLIDRLVAVGDRRAWAAGRHTRRTLAEMAPGHERQPVLRMTRPLTFRSSDEPCLFCGRWLCPGCSGAAPAPATAHTHAA